MTTKAKKLSFTQIVDAIQSRRSIIEKDVTDILRPIRDKLSETDYRLFRAEMLGFGYLGGWDLTIGRDGKTNCQAGQSFHFEVERGANKIICGRCESQMIETREDLDLAIEWLEVALAKAAYNHFADETKGADRLMRALRPLEWHRRHA
jgi:hypothetical protein